MVREFDPLVWFQVSGHFRLAAKLPEGKTGKQALADTDCGDAAWIEGLGEAHCGDHYLLCYAAHTGMSKEEWKAFKESGGSTYGRMG